MSSDTRSWFRNLYHEILDYRRFALFYDLLLPWSEQVQVALADWQRFQTPTPYDPDDEPARLAMFNLYAFSRVNDLLLMPFQDKDHNDFSTDRLTLVEYIEFYTRCGFTVIERDQYAPFHHEIVRVHSSSEDEEPPGVLAQRWPGLMLGPMMFSRSGVEVYAGRQHILPALHNNLPLHKNRRGCTKTSGWRRKPGRWWPGFFNNKTLDHISCLACHSLGAHFFGTPGKRQEF